MGVIVLWMSFEIGRWTKLNCLWCVACAYPGTPFRSDNEGDEKEDDFFGVAARFLWSVVVLFMAFRLLTGMLLVCWACRIIWSDFAATRLTSLFCRAASIKALKSMDWWPLDGATFGRFVCLTRSGIHVARFSALRLVNIALERKDIKVWEGGVNYSCFDVMSVKPPAFTLPTRTRSVALSAAGLTRDNVEARLFLALMIDSRIALLDRVISSWGKKQVY